jgi:hypothetical protein
MEKNEIVQSFIDSDYKKLEWQFSDDKFYVELLYCSADDNDILNEYVIRADCSEFDKDVEYLHSVYYSDGYQQDIRDTTINITDEDADFDINDIVYVFYELSKTEKGMNKIELINMND